MKVSIITPTCNRPAHLQYLYRFYRAQTYPDKELLIADDSAQANPFFSTLSDPTVKYWHLKSKETIGWKRDRLVKDASGECIVQFDDDDYYAPNYVASAVRALLDADFFKLTSWYGYHVGRRLLFYCDMSRMFPYHYKIHAQEGLSMADMAGLTDEWLKMNSWGYGFSYAFRKSLYEKVQFDLSKNWGEDSDFVQRVSAQGFRMSGIPDEGGLALHVMHSSNTSCVFPNCLLPQFMLDRIFGSTAKEYMDRLSARKMGEIEPMGPEAPMQPLSSVRGP